MGIANVEHANTLIFHCPAFAPFVGFVPLSAIAILDDRPDTYDEMDAAAKRKATIDTKKIIAEVAKKLDSDKAERVEHIDAVGVKVDRIRKRDRRGRHAKQSTEAREACIAFWKMAQAR